MFDLRMCLTCCSDINMWQSLLQSPHQASSCLLNFLALTKLISDVLHTLLQFLGRKTHTCCSKLEKQDLLSPQLKSQNALLGFSITVSVLC